MMKAVCLFLFAATAVACASETTTGTSANAPSSAPCSAEECAKLHEPPISPTACGAGHENEIGTVCGRATNGQCNKMLTCGGKRPE